MLRRLADQGHADAQEHMGVCLLQVSGAIEDEKRQWLGFARLLSKDTLLRNSIWGFAWKKAQNAQDTKQAVVLFRQAAEQGHVKAQLKLGVWLVNSPAENFAQQALTEAAAWFRKAAEQGNADGQCCLALVLGNGVGVEKDEKQAVEWYSRAAAQGHAKALFDLAESFASGNLTVKNEKEAVEWYRKAAEKGHSQAQFNLAVRLHVGTGTAKDEKQAVSGIAKLQLKATLKRSSNWAAWRVQ